MAVSWEKEKKLQNMYNTMTWSKTPKRLIHRDISHIISIEESKVGFKLFIIYIV